MSEWPQKVCAYCGDVYFERECESCEQLANDEAANAHHDQRRPTLHSRNRSCSVLTQTHRRKIDALMEQPEFLANVQPMTDYFDKCYGTKENGNG